MALGDKEEKIDFDKIDKSLKTSKIFDFVNSLPKGVNTNCGELGEKLSEVKDKELVYPEHYIETLKC